VSAFKASLGKIMRQDGLESIGLAWPCGVSRSYGMTSAFLWQLSWKCHGTRSLLADIALLASVRRQHHLTVGAKSFTVETLVGAHEDDEVVLVLCRMSWR
jgi:hypothetical protein